MRVPPSWSSTSEFLRLDQCEHEIDRDQHCDGDANHVIAAHRNPRNGKHHAANPSLTGCGSGSGAPREPSAKAASSGPMIRSQATTNRPASAKKTTSASMNTTSCTARLLHQLSEMSCTKPLYRPGTE